MTELSAVDEIVSVDEDRLVYRIDYIRENLLQLTKNLRDKVPQNISDQDMMLQLKMKIMKTLIECYTFCLIELKVIWGC